MLLVSQDEVLSAPITDRKKLIGENFKSAFTIFFPGFPSLLTQRLVVLEVDCLCAFSGISLKTLPSGT